MLHGGQSQCSHVFQLCPTLSDGLLTQCVNHSASLLQLSAGVEQNRLAAVVLLAWLCPCASWPCPSPAAAACPCPCPCPCPSPAAAAAACPCPCPSPAAAACPSLCPCPCLCTRMHSVTPTAPNRTAAATQYLCMYCHCIWLRLLHPATTTISSQHTIRLPAHLNRAILFTI